jgi:hypothetical protein
MKISEVIKMLVTEMAVEGDAEMLIYDSTGCLIEPKSFCYGSAFIDGMSADAIGFSDLEPHGWVSTSINQRTKP